MLVFNIILRISSNHEVTRSSSSFTGKALNASLVADSNLLAEISGGVFGLSRKTHH